MIPAPTSRDAACFNSPVTRDWLRWHEHYDAPASSLVLRLAAVRRQFRHALAEAMQGEDEAVRVTSICAGEGRDVLPVLAERSLGRPVRALLLELDPILVERAGRTAAELGLSEVEVRRADAGAADTYLDVPPAHVLLVCGVFGNISGEDVERTIAALPALLADDGIVIWTRGAENVDRDRSREIKTCFEQHGFTPMSFISTEDGVFRVGTHRLAVDPRDVRPLPARTRLFTFL